MSTGKFKQSAWRQWLALNFVLLGTVEWFPTRSFLLSWHGRKIDEPLIVQPTPSNIWTCLTYLCIAESLLSTIVLTCFVMLSLISCHTPHWGCPSIVFYLCLADSSFGRWHSPTRWLTHGDIECKPHGCCLLWTGNDPWSHFFAASLHIV